MIQTVEEAIKALQRYSDLPNKELIYMNFITREECEEIYGDDISDASWSKILDSIEKNDTTEFNADEAVCEVLHADD